MSILSGSLKELLSIDNWKAVGGFTVWSAERTKRWKLKIPTSTRKVRSLETSPDKMVKIQIERTMNRFVLDDSHKTKTLKCVLRIMLTCFLRPTLKNIEYVKLLASFSNRSPTTNRRRFGLPFTIFFFFFI